MAPIEEKAHTKGFAKRALGTETYNFVGETLREYRMSKELTEESMANLFGITQSQWSAYELGVTRMSFDKILITCVLLNIDPIEFFKRAFAILEEMKKKDNT